MKFIWRCVDGGYFYRHWHPVMSIRQGFVHEAKLHSAHTVELNLEPKRGRQRV